MDAAVLPPALPVLAGPGSRPSTAVPSGRDAGPGGFAAELQQATSGGSATSPATGTPSTPAAHDDAGNAAATGRAGARDPASSTARGARGDPTTDPRRSPVATSARGGHGTASASRTDASPDDADGTDAVDGLASGRTLRAPRLAHTDDETDAGPITDAALPAGPQPLPWVEPEPTGWTGAAAAAAAAPGDATPSLPDDDAPDGSASLEALLRGDDAGGDGSTDATARAGTRRTLRSAAGAEGASGGDAAGADAVRAAADEALKGRGSTSPGSGATDTPAAAAAAAPSSTQPAAPTAPVHSFAAELASAQGSAHAATPAATPAAAPPATELQLPVPVLSQAFAPQLGGTIAVLARDGIQEARVHLHPAELGPISVQISVDGQAAQVHLAVDNALTRQLLESALPTLAGALRESGLTLTGGGVFERPRQDPGADANGRGQGQAAAAQAGDARGDAAGPVDTRVEPVRARRVGALDLYA